MLYMAHDFTLAVFEVGGTPATHKMVSIRVRASNSNHTFLGLGRGEALD